MKPAYLIAAIALLVIGDKLNTEWQGVKLRIATAEKAITATAEQGTSTLKTVEETIEELKAKLFRMESGGELQQCPAPDPKLAEKLAELERLVADLAEAKSQEPVKGPEPTVAPTKPTIIMHSSPTCLPCKMWLKYNAPDWTSKGWTLRVIEETYSENSWPWFEVYENGQKTTVQGPLTEASYRKAKLP